MDFNIICHFGMWEFIGTVELLGNMPRFFNVFGTALVPSNFNTTTPGIFVNGTLQVNVSLNLFGVYSSFYVTGDVYLNSTQVTVYVTQKNIGDINTNILTSQIFFNSLNGSVNGR